MFANVQPRGQTFSMSYRVEGLVFRISVWGLVFRHHRRGHPHSQCCLCAACSASIFIARVTEHNLRSSAPHSQYAAGECGRWRTDGKGVRHSALCFVGIREGGGKLRGDGVLMMRIRMSPWARSGAGRGANLRLRFALMRVPQLASCHAIALHCRNETVGANQAT